MALKNNNAAKEQYNVKVERAHRFDNGSIAIDLKVNGVNIYGATYRVKKDSDEGFISFPARKGSNDQWYNYCWFPVSPVQLADIEDQIDSLLA